MRISSYVVNVDIDSAHSLRVYLHCSMLQFAIDREEASDNVSSSNIKYDQQTNNNNIGDTREGILYFLALCGVKVETRANESSNQSEWVTQQSKQQSRIEVRKQKTERGRRKTGKPVVEIILHFKWHWSTLIGGMAWRKRESTKVIKLHNTHNTEQLVRWSS